ncbi:hypothetical protein LJB71_03910 [Thermomonas sp. S9]|nr:hypothetical protein [Thermomonas sp. S9]
MRLGVIGVDERAQLEALRALTLDTIMVDDFDSEELRAAHAPRAARAAA